MWFVFIWNTWPPVSLKEKRAMEEACLFFTESMEVTKVTSAYSVDSTQPKKAHGMFARHFPCYQHFSSEIKIHVSSSKRRTNI